MHRRCSAPVVVAGVVTCYAAFFAMGAALGRLLYERLRG